MKNGRASLPCQETTLAEFTEMRHQMKELTHQIEARTESEPVGGMPSHETKYRTDTLRKVILVLLSWSVPLVIFTALTAAIWWLSRVTKFQ